MVHPELNENEKKKAGKRFYDDYCCCLDPYFASKLRRLFPTLELLVAARVPMRLLEAWMNRGKITSGHVERAHAEHNVSFVFTRQNRRRHAEGGILRSFVKKLMKYHVKRGRQDFSLRKNEALLAVKKTGLKTAKTLRKWYGGSSVQGHV